MSNGSLSTVAPLTGSLPPPAGDEPPMEIEITDGFMRLYPTIRSLDQSGSAAAPASGWWCWPVRVSGASSQAPDPPLSQHGGMARDELGQLLGQG